MTYRLKAWTGILAFAVALVCVAALTRVPHAYAEQVTIDTGAPVVASACKVCHGQIAEVESDLVDFTHATHMWFACSNCHLSYPHTPAGTDVPAMVECWNCHGLQHGPMGLIAGDTCEKCHGARVERLRPESHVAEWAETPHVDPAENALRTECAMCHDRADCDTCHAERDVEWRSDGLTYDVGDGCLACHGNPDLAKASRGGSESYFVDEDVLDWSAHRDITCVECHVDFNYTGERGATPLWQVNAGLACLACHEGAYGERPAQAELVSAYEASIHGTLIAEGDYTSATCGSCHGGHSIARLDTDAARRELHFASERMCAQCHSAEWATYDDYYHGAPYKRRAGRDTPSCWDCHGSHEALPVSDPNSMMYPVNAVATCGECHRGSGEAFIEHSAGLIHGQSVARDENPLLRWWRSVRGGS
ncbi:MAG: hypothetical protein KGZ40_06125 [Clostridiales bacterium]|nr:hypothetical protein [Clostridiales bacterium]